MLTRVRWLPASGRATLATLLAVTGLLADREGLARATINSEFRPADSVVVAKSERRLYLIRDGRPFRSYRVSLGLNPAGPKLQEGDFRTPEGRYLIDGRNVHSEYYLALHVSYPNANDQTRARAAHVPAGGAIMIHGLPNTPRKPPSFYLSNDWTNGCIALSNDDMLEVWLLTRPDTPIEIKP